MHKVECFLLNIKELYPTFKYPSSSMLLRWKELLSPYSADEIIFAIKQWRKNYGTELSPSIDLFTSCLTKRTQKNLTKRTLLPFNPENHLMEQDIKANRCKYLYPTYRQAVRYILNVRLKEFFTKEEFKKLNYSQRYIEAVERGLFADFDKTLDFVSTKGGYYD